MISFEQTIFDLAYKGVFEEIKEKIKESNGIVLSRDSVSLLLLFKKLIMPSNRVQNKIVL